MALIAACSAKGSPGVTTSVLAMAVRSTRKTIIVDADPLTFFTTLYSVFGFQISDPAGMHNRLFSLAEHADDPQLTQWVDSVAHPVGDRFDVPPDKVKLITGVDNPFIASSTTIQRAWGSLGMAMALLDQIDIDVIVDLGRLAHPENRTPLLRQVDQVLVFTGATAQEIIGPTHTAVRTLTSIIDADLDDTGSIGIVVLPRDGLMNYPSSDIAHRLGRSVLATLPWDPSSAANYMSGHSSAKKRHGRSRFDRSIDSLNETVADRVRTKREVYGLTRTDNEQGVRQ